MADLGFVETIAEDDEVPVEEESTDSDEEVCELVYNITFYVDTFNYLIVIHLRLKELLSLVIAQCVCTKHV